MYVSESCSSCTVVGQSSSYDVVGCRVCVCVSVGEQDKFILSCKVALCLVLERKLLHIDGFTMLNS